MLADKAESLIQTMWRERFTQTQDLPQKSGYTYEVSLP
jgi:hypothetical protein